MIMRATGKTLAQILEDLSNKSGLLGMSGLSGDVRDLENAAANGNARADLALKVFSCSRSGNTSVPTDGARRSDAIVFTGGIGEKASAFARCLCGDGMGGHRTGCTERISQSSRQ